MVVLGESVVTEMVLGVCFGLEKFLLVWYRESQPAAIMEYGIHVKCTNTARVGLWVKSVAWGVEVSRMNWQQIGLDVFVF